MAVEGYPEMIFCNTDGNDATKIQDEKELRSLFAFEKQLQKTKLCRYHMKGLCRHGSDCRFAHGKDELAQLPNLQKTRMCPSLLANGHCGNPETCTFAHHESELKKVNICHKTAICTWYLAGKCRNGTKCDFAHGEHELQGGGATKNAKNSMPEQKTTKPDNNGYKRREPMFIQPSITATAPTPSPYKPSEDFAVDNQLAQQYQVQPPSAQWPAAGPPLGPMPNIMQGMQPAYGFGAYGAAYPSPQLMMPPNYMSMPNPAMMEQYAGVEPVASLPPGLGGDAVAAAANTPLVPACLPDSSSQKSWQLTELALQFNMLSEEVKRLQEYIIPGSMQSTNSGSGCSTRSSSDNKTPRAAAESAAAAGAPRDNSTSPVDMDDRRSFEEKVAHLQKELKNVMDEGQRCGKFFQTIDM